MALIQLNYVSSALFRTVTVNVVLPCDKLDADRKHYLNRGKKFKTLYLLHGLIGNYTDWISGTRVQRLAEKNDLAVVMPSGDNSFYVNSYAIPNNDYGRFIGEELVEVTRAMFPLSDKREDTFVGGLSMGGFGALRTGLKYSDTFSAIISLSGALHVFEDEAGHGAKIQDENWAFGRSIFGPAETAMKSDNNPRVLLDDLQASGKGKESLPKIFMACGTDDFLLPGNRSFSKELKERGLDLTYIEAPGNHNWFFWDTYIKEALDWLPLEEKFAGMDSGNIAKKINS